MPDTTKKIDHKYTSNIVCPYCGYEYTDSWEFEDDCDDYECADCEKVFTYERHVTVEYCTSKKKEAPHPIEKIIDDMRRRAAKYGLEEEVLVAYHAYRKQGYAAQQAAWQALSDWDL
jgi:hypothetical protein